MNINKTERFKSDWNKLPFGLRYIARKLIKIIVKTPIPNPETDDWKELKQFRKDYPEGSVFAIRLSWEDRIVYEVTFDLENLNFTNCLGHRYRGKTYSDETIIEKGCIKT